MWKSTAYQKSGKMVWWRNQKLFPHPDWAFWSLPLRALIMETVQNMERQEQKYRSHWAIPFYNHFISNNSGLCSVQCSASECFRAQQYYSWGQWKLTLPNLDLCSLIWKGLAFTLLKPLMLSLVLMHESLNSS